MLELLPILSLAQVVTAMPAPGYTNNLRAVIQPHDVRPLPGQLDAVPVFNSNSPEVVQSNGILLSTFPSEGMAVPSAHLNYRFEGRFDIFAHHIARGLNPDDVRTLYQGLLVYNPSDRPVQLDILQAASYLSQEAPFNDLPAYVANPMGTVFAGPGSRTMNDILRGLRQPNWPSEVTIPPRRVYLLMNAPIPLRPLSDLLSGVPLPMAVPAAVNASTAVATSGGAPLPPLPPPRRRDVPSNGRSTLMYLSSSGPVYVASLAMYAPTNADGSERAPSIMEWLSVLRTGGLATPRDIPPTPPDRRIFTRFYYGRVAGVAQGSQWTARITDGPNTEQLSIPQPGQAYSYLLSTVDNGTFGTGQIQSAPILARYPDTAYRAHGNYGVHYNITLPLHNRSDQTQQVTIMLQTPLKERDSIGGLRFLQPPDDQVFFRGTVRIRYTDDFGITETRYLHLVQRRGQQGEPLVRLTLPKGDRRLVQIDFLYPPDSTPPQALTIQTTAPISAME